jgi:hypothetical protein
MRLLCRHISERRSIVCRSSLFLQPQSLSAVWRPPPIRLQPRSGEALAPDSVSATCLSVSLSGPALPTIHLPQSTLCPRLLSTPGIIPLPSIPRRLCSSTATTATHTGLAVRAGTVGATIITDTGVVSIVGLIAASEALRLAGLSGIREASGQARFLHSGTSPEVSLSADFKFKSVGLRDSIRFHATTPVDYTGSSERFVSIALDM